MGKEVLTFGYIATEKHKFYHNKSPVPLRDVDIQKVLVSNKISLAKKSYKYFVGYLYNDHDFKPLHKILPETSGFVKSYYGQTKWTCFVD